QWRRDWRRLGHVRARRRVCRSLRLRQFRGKTISHSRAYIMPKHSFLQRRARSVALGALFIAAVSPAAAQANRVVVDKRIVAAKVFIEESKPELACALIKRSHGADTRHAEALYLLALCSRDLGDREESIGYYERLVEVLPEAPRPKAELAALRSEEHTSELQSRENLVCRLLLEKKNRMLNSYRG